MFLLPLTEMYKIRKRNERQTAFWNELTLYMFVLPLTEMQRRSGKECKSETSCFFVIDSIYVPAAVD